MNQSPGNHTKVSEEDIYESVQIVKEDGVKESFSPAKLEKSLLKSGANLEVAHDIIKTIIDEMSRGVCDVNSNDRGLCSVGAIYARAFEMLKEMSKSAAARYSLRRSLMQFGPTGFPFESYISELFSAYGYDTLTGQIVYGGCVPHEVDVVAWKEQELIMAEVKYHNEPSGKTDLKTALYVKARFDDLKDTVFTYKGMPPRKIDRWLLITNTRFTDTAIKYVECKGGVTLMSWSYPEDINLFTMIEETKLHPITCLLTLTQNEKQQLIQNKIVLCKSVYKNKNILEKLGFSKEKIAAVFEEIASIINLKPADK